MHAPVKPLRPAVLFRDVREEDLPLLFGLRRDLALQSLLLTVPDALDDQSLRGWIARRQQDPGGLFRAVEEVSTGQAVGYAQISQVHRRNGVGYAGIALVADVRGRGLGQATLAKLIRVSREELGLNKLLSEVRIDNFAALKYNLLLGFQIVGTLKSHFADSDGVRHDVLFLERLLDDV
jgi:RimJ/RimL family protein N-acetyltransferase